MLARILTFATHGPDGRPWNWERCQMEAKLELDLGAEGPSEQGMALDGPDLPDVDVPRRLRPGLNLTLDLLTCGAMLAGILLITDRPSLGGWPPLGLGAGALLLAAALAGLVWWGNEGPTFHSANAILMPVMMVFLPRFMLGTEVALLPRTLWWVKVVSPVLAPLGVGFTYLLNGPPGWDI
jgi:hypothetical protein